jgi:hypothetical protein
MNGVIADACPRAAKIDIELPAGEVKKSPCISSTLAEDNRRIDD